VFKVWKSIFILFKVLLDKFPSLYYLKNGHLINEVCCVVVNCWHISFYGVVWVLSVWNLFNRVV